MGAESKVELLWWPECPSHDRALADLRAAVGELGLDRRAVRVVRIDSEEDAARERFAGSPTIRVDGEDVCRAAASRRADVPPVQAA